MGLDQARWATLADRLHCPALADRFDSIVEAYNEPHRRYHTAQHICECLNALDEAKHLVSDSPELEVALWLHDVVYRTLRAGSEEASATKAAEWLREAGASEACCDGVVHLIMLTKHPSKPETLAEQLLVDIDLNVLGAPESRYQEYEEQVRIEFKAVPSFLFKRKRAELLEGFLEAGPVYHTDWFRDLLEDQARSNLRRAISSLRT